jgi:hypothetical protein
MPVLRFQQYNRRRKCGFISVGGAMSLHYQVIADFSLIKGRPSLIALSLHSTSAACTLWPVPGSFVKYTSLSRIFHTLKAAHSYISYLMGLYSNSSVPFPVLDKGQKDLFQGVLE